MHRKHPQTHKPTLVFSFSLSLVIGLALLLQPYHAVLSQTSGNMTAALEGALQIAVKDAIVTLKGTSATDAISLFDVQSVGDWAAGSAMVYAIDDGEESSPYLFPFVARWDQSQVQIQWQVAVEYAPNYVDMLRAAPQAILSPIHVVGLAGPGLAAPSQTMDVPQLGLPWALGETQYLTSGPHSDAAFKRQRPWSAIDFAGGSSNVRAAADGVVYLMPGCPYVQINHGNGWQTGYYHLVQIAVRNGQSITRGTLLGRQSTATNCGGQVTGAHVHMTLRLNGQFQNWHDQALGGWRVEEGDIPYDGCLIRSTLRRCATSAIYNDGIIGEGDGSLPVLTATPTNTPRPTAIATSHIATRTPVSRTPVPRTVTPTVRVSQVPILTATPGPPELAIVPEEDGVCGLTTIQLNAKLPDNTAKMSCFNIPITATGIISELAVSVGMTHTWVSDLRMQLRSPNGQFLTLLNRPGWPTNAFGFGANLSPLYPITFTQRGNYDAEKMGGADTRRVICRDDHQCEFTPNADQDISANTAGIEALAGTLSAGNWQVCISDSAKGDLGVVASIGLDLHCAVASEKASEDVCAPVSVTPDRLIPDNNAKGLCVDVVVPFTGTVKSVALDLGIDHTFLGDLRAQLIGPNQLTLTLMNRSGQPVARFGDTSNLASAFPIEFVDDAPNDLKQMGQSLGGNGIVCRDDLRCHYRPNANGDPATRLSALNEWAGQPSAGVWRVCISDLSPKDIGRLHAVNLDLTCSAETPLTATPNPQLVVTPITAIPPETPMPTPTEPSDPEGGLLKAEELDEPAVSTVWLPMLIAGDIPPSQPSPTIRIAGARADSP